MDVLISFAWFAAFGILVDAIHHLPCGSIWSWRFGGDAVCGRWKAAEAFSFLSAIVWLMSAIVVCICVIHPLVVVKMANETLAQGLWFTYRVRDYGAGT